MSIAEQYMINRLYMQRVGQLSLSLAGLHVLLGRADAEFEMAAAKQAGHVGIASYKRGGCFPAPQSDATGQAHYRLNNRFLVRVAPTLARSPMPAQRP